MTQNAQTTPTVKRESKNKIRVEFERTSLKERLKAKYLSAYFAKNVLWYIFRLFLLIGIAFVIVKPFYTMIMRSFMAPENFMDTTVVNVPRAFSAVIYKSIIVNFGYFKYFFSTLAFSLSVALLQTFSCCLIGYGLAKFKFRGAKVVFFLVILTLAIPHGTLQSAIFYRFRYMDIFGIFNFLAGGARTGWEWLDAILAKIKILPADKFLGGLNLTSSVVPIILLSITGLAFKNGLYIFLLRQFFRGVPDELEESAYLDGANTFRTFVQVILPLSVPMMITVFLFAFCWQWTDDFYLKLFFVGENPIFMTYLPEYTTVNGIPVLLSAAKAEAGNSSQFDVAIRYACGLMVCTPLIILYLFCQRYLVQGIERSGIVG